MVSLRPVWASWTASATAGECGHPEGSPSQLETVDCSDPETLPDQMLCLWSSHFEVPGSEPVPASVSRWLNDAHTDHLAGGFEGRKVSAFR